MSGPDADDDRSGEGDGRPARPRPLLERLGLALVAVVMAAVFGGLAVASWVGGELFLAVMAGIGALMTLWAALANLRRG